MSEMVKLLSWREPLWLFLALLPIVPWVIRKVMQHKRPDFADAALMPWLVVRERHAIWHRIFSKNTAYLLAWLLFALAAAGPRMPIETATQAQETAMDIMLVVDVSKSMRVADTHPTRLRRAQIEIAELLERSRGSRVGIIVFAARPHLYAPLTADYEAVRFYLKTLDDLVLPTSGTNVQAAIAMARSELTVAKQQDNPVPSGIVLMTDGEYSPAGMGMDGDKTEITPILENPLIPIYTLGLGTMEGEAIPAKGGGWLMYAGNPVISRMNGEILESLAAKSGGRFSPATDDDSDWKTLYDNGLAKQLPFYTDRNQLVPNNWHELFSWFLLPGCFLLFIALCPYDLRVKSLFYRGSLLAVTFFLLPLSLYHTPVFADDVKEVANDLEAFQYYKAGNYSEALTEYRKLAGYEGRLGEAASLYRLGKYTAAITQFSQAILAARNDHDRAVALFNLGNSYFQLGDYPSAILMYKNSLHYGPKNKAAQHNLAFTIELEKNVYLSAQRRKGSARIGSGPQLMEPMESQMIRQDTTLSVGESQTQDMPQTPLPLPLNISDKTLQALIEKGLKYIKLAGDGTNEVTKSKHDASKLDLIEAHLRMNELADTQAMLWKQVFENEEGFTAPLHEPREVQGVAPW